MTGKPLTIESSSGWFRATLTNSPDGIFVTVWEKKPGAVYKRIHQDTIDAPMSVVAPKMQDLVDQLKRTLAEVKR